MNKRMNLRKSYRHFVNGLLAMALIFLLFKPAISTAATEQTFDVLQIGTHTYRNVTVTTKSKKYIFIIHSTGMENIKLADVPPEIRTKLGYDAMASEEASKAGSSSLSSWTKQTVGKLHLPQVKEIQRQLRSGGPASLATINLGRNFTLVLVGSVVLLYMLICYCGFLICEKTGNRAGVLVWIPVIQLIPLLRAAGMSPAWFLAFLVPLLNIIAQIVWSFNIAKARGKSAWVGFLLVLPLTSLFAYLYLAFSKDEPKEERPIVEIMTLETA